MDKNETFTTTNSLKRKKTNSKSDPQKAVNKTEAVAKEVAAKAYNIPIDSGTIPTSSLKRAKVRDSEFSLQANAEKTEAVAKEVAAKAYNTPIDSGTIPTSSLKRAKVRDSQFSLQANVAKVALVLDDRYKNSNKEELRKPSLKGKQFSKEDVRNLEAQASFIEKTQKLPLTLTKPKKAEQIISELENLVSAKSANAIPLAVSQNAVNQKISNQNAEAKQVFDEVKIKKHEIFTKNPEASLQNKTGFENQEFALPKEHVLSGKKRVKKTPENVPHFIGHRARLKEKCYKFAANLSDYEILEIMLFWAIPRKDTKTLAKLLLTTFGSLSEILYAEEDKLLAVPQITKNIRLNFTIIKEFLERILKSRFINKHVLSSWSALIEYLQTTMGDIKTEQFRVIFLNKKNMVIADEVQASGTVDQTPVYPREIVKRALFHEASAIILVHNHPSGNPRPSKADIAITQEIKQACESLSILLHDHVIVCKNKFLSFKSEYLL